MTRKRYLVVVADDFGIGPATSRGILDLAHRGLVTGTVLLVNSPYAEAEVQTWRREGAPLELGWHPCLTLDCPVLAPGQVPSLVRPDGTFWPLDRFLHRLILGRICPAEVEAELSAQLSRFQDLVGRPPAGINSHHHIQVFSPVGTILDRLLLRLRPLPYVRRVREPWRLFWAVPGARPKRGLLSVLGRLAAQRQAAFGFPGNDWLVGITDPPCVVDADFLGRWLRNVPGQVVELTCHPGFLDTTLIGRDCAAHDAQMLRREREYHLLRQTHFAEACCQAGFILVSPSEIAQRFTAGKLRAA